MNAIRVALGCILLLAVTASAQTTSGRIVGTAIDASGAIVPRVAVTVRNLETNITSGALTGESGAYVIPDLAIGTYEVTAELAGFKKVVQSPLQLSVEQTLRVDLRMEPGQVNETVTVGASAPLLDTDQSSVSQVIENKAIVELPLNGRNFLKLGSLLPGTTTGIPGDIGRPESQEGASLTANGQRAESNNFLLDGVEDRGILIGVVAVIPPIDAIAEFKVQTSNYSAEFGNGAGALVNMATKSGTNQLHGSAYEFLRNSRLDAADFFTNYFARSKVPLKRNQFGAALGGPIRKNKLFLFGNYEGYRIRTGSTSANSVPTAAQRAGNFTGLATIYDALNLDATGKRIPFAGNQIPADRISPISIKAESFWPLPNNPGTANNYIVNLSNPTNADKFTGRADYYISVSDQIMARYSRQDYNTYADAIAGSGQSVPIYNRNAVLGWIHNVSSRSLNEFRLAYLQYNLDRLQQDPTVDHVTPVGLPLNTFGPNSLGYPNISIANIAVAGGGTGAQPLIRLEAHADILDNFSMIRGAHTFKFGIDWRVFRSNDYQPRSGRGAYSFSGAFTGQVGSAYSNGFGDYLLGFPASETIANFNFYDNVRLRNQRLMLYAQDDWQVSRKLTLNLGVRWERDGNWTESKDRWSYVDLGTGQVVFPKNLQIPSMFLPLPFPSRFDAPDNFKKPTNLAFTPRIGFAYRPFSDSKTVIRAGYGVFWGQAVGIIFINTAGLTPPFLLTQNLTSGTTTPELRTGIFPNAAASSLVPTIPSGFFTQDPRTITNPYAQMWNFGVEREIVSNVALKVGYVGNKDTHLEDRWQGNPALPAGPGAVQARRLYPLLGNFVMQGTDAFATYHSLQSSVEVRRKNTLWLVGYTWSKTLDNSSGWNGGSGDTSPLNQNPLNHAAEKGRADMDIRHRFTTTFVYEVPWMPRNSLLKQIAGGWEVSGLFAAQSGFPFTVVVPGDIPNANTGLTRANLNGPGNLPADQRTIAKWFNTAAFTVPASYTFGNEGRNVLDGPGAVTLDAAAMKSFRITEMHHLQFRAELFNALNHVAFNFPNQTLTNAAFGTISSGSSGRQIQLALKYIF